MDAEAHARGRQVGGRTVEHDAALEHDDAVEVVGDRAQFVGDEQDRGVVVLDEVDERVAELLLRGVEDLIQVLARQRGNQ